MPARTEMRNRRALPSLVEAQHPVHAHLSSAGAVEQAQKKEAQHG